MGPITASFRPCEQCVCCSYVRFGNVVHSERRHTAHPDRVDGQLSVHVGISVLIDHQKRTACVVFDRECASAAKRVVNVLPVKCCRDKKGHDCCKRGLPHLNLH